MHEMLASHPEAPANQAAVADALEALASCAAHCRSCADACLAEEDPAELRECIRLDLDCADICSATAAVLARSSGTHAIDRSLLDACMASCEACGAECSGHADHHDHCARCAEACRRCADACRVLAS